MKYQDKRFQKFQEKQRDGLNDSYSCKTDRQIKREKDHYHSVFFSKFFQNKFDKDWWNCLKSLERDEISTHYDIQMECIKSGYEMWSNYELFETIEEWFGFIKSKYKPDMIRFRELKFKKIGI
jgi:hypothetical protein